MDAAHRVWQVQDNVIGAQLGRTLDRIPESYRQAKGFHLGIHPDEPNLDFIHQLRTLAGLGMTGLPNLWSALSHSSPLTDG